jgi:transposase
MTTAGIDISSWRVAERVASTDKLTRAGWSAAEIAVRIGVRQRTIERYRARLKATTSHKPQRRPAP